MNSYKELDAADHLTIRRDQNTRGFVITHEESKNAVAIEAESSLGVLFQAIRQLLVSSPAPRIQVLYEAPEVEEPTLSPSSLEQAKLKTSYEVSVDDTRLQFDQLSDRDRGWNFDVGQTFIDALVLLNFNARRNGLSFWEFSIAKDALDAIQSSTTTRKIL